jgi:CO/xanthine dehydrogenase Mo-binding subunit
MTSPIGLSLLRKEDERLLRGRGRYVDDLHLPGLLHAALVRSPHAHARIERVDARAALATPGVVAVLTITDLPECAGAVLQFVPSPALRAYAHPALAGPVARFAGEGVAVVVADDPYRATDGAHAVTVDYTPLPVAATVDAAGGARVFDEWPDNHAGTSTTTVGDPTRGFAEAEVVVDLHLVFPRIAGMPIEPRGVMATPPAHDGGITVWTLTQVPFAVRAAIARALAMSEERVRVRAPDVGGGFGIKGHVYPEDVLVPAVARRLGRPVKWIETRREHFLSAAPDRDQRHTARLGVRRDGAITALETEGTRDHGAYPMLGDARALARLDWDGWRAEQTRRRGSARPIGLGVSAYVEGTGIGPFESADVRIDPSGAVYVLLGVSSQGQAHACPSRRRACGKRCAPARRSARSRSGGLQHQLVVVGHLAQHRRGHVVDQRLVAVGRRQHHASGPPGRGRDHPHGHHRLAREAPVDGGRDVGAEQHRPRLAAVHPDAPRERAGDHRSAQDDRDH